MRAHKKPRLPSALRIFVFPRLFHISKPLTGHQRRNSISRIPERIPQTLVNGRLISRIPGRIITLKTPDNGSRECDECVGVLTNEGKPNVLTYMVCTRERTAPLSRALSPTALTVKQKSRSDASPRLNVYFVVLTHRFSLKSRIPEREITLKTPDNGSRECDE